MEIKTTVIQKITAGGIDYQIGDRVRVMLKSNTGRNSEFIGTVRKIFGDSFVIDPDLEEKLILVDRVEKMRAAAPGETFDNHFDY